MRYDRTGNTISLCGLVPFQSLKSVNLFISIISPLTSTSTCIWPYKKLHYQNICCASAEFKEKLTIRIADHTSTSEIWSDDRSTFRGYKWCEKENSFSIMIRLPTNLSCTTKHIVTTLRSLDLSNESDPICGLHYKNDWLTHEMRRAPLPVCPYTLRPCLHGVLSSFMCKIKSSI